MICLERILTSRGVQALLDLCIGPEGDSPEKDRTEQKAAVKESKRKRMAEQCFKKKGTDPPVCGVHNVPLVQSQVPIDRDSPGPMQITCLRCPVSRAVALDAQRFQPRKPN
jgi:hypothetical protein